MGEITATLRKVYKGLILRWIMLDEYPRFKRGQSREAYEKLPAKDKQILEEYVKYCLITAGRDKVEDNKRDIIRLRLVIDSFDKLDLKALRHFLFVLEKSNLLTETKNNAKIHIQKFLRWHFKDWSERFDEFKDVKTRNGLNEEKINGKTLLTKDEIEKIIRKENSLFWKAYFLVQYEGGLRTKEARSIKWEDLRFNIDGDISELNIYATKTKKARVVYLKEATFYLQRLKEESERKSPFVFPSAMDVNKPITKFSVSRWFKNHVSKVIGRKIWAYILRHTRAKELYITNGGKIPEKTAQKFMGHKKSMVDVYSHISNEDIKEAMSKIIYKFEDLPEQKKHELEEEIKKHKAQLKILFEEVKATKEHLIKIGKEHNRVFRKT